MFIDYDHQKVEVPKEIVRFCDSFVLDSTRNDLEYLDCIYMNMGYYGNDLEDLEEMRYRIMPVFE
jgi:hypothetical protein